MDTITVGTSVHKLGQARKHSYDELYKSVYVANRYIVKTFAGYKYS